MVCLCYFTIRKINHNSIDNVLSLYNCTIYWFWWKYTNTIKLNIYLIADNHSALAVFILRRKKISFCRKSKLYNLLFLIFFFFLSRTTLFQWVPALICLHNEMWAEINNLQNRTFFIDCHVEQSYTTVVNIFINLEF